ncbi:PREDICTED: titin-like [Vollenhovia emeryi]|uniref:titin-like n=1 Tax=Vollenhovia emeryi TaxID=411798 RepID=UPI0005F44B95|nr:PREDICTED: titin-like [Vollenhovia emeryi]
MSDKCKVPSADTVKKMKENVESSEGEKREQVTSKKPSEKVAKMIDKSVKPSVSSLAAKSVPKMKEAVESKERAKTEQAASKKPSENIKRGREMYEEKISPCVAKMCKISSSKIEAAEFPIVRIPNFPSKIFASKKPENPEAAEKCQASKTTPEASPSAELELPKVPTACKIPEYKSATPISIEVKTPKVPEAGETTKTTHEAHTSVTPEACQVPKAPEICHISTAMSKISLSDKSENYPKDLKECQVMENLCSQIAASVQSENPEVPFPHLVCDFDKIGGDLPIPDIPELLEFERSLSNLEARKVPKVHQVAKTTSEMSASAKPETPEVPEIPPLCNLAKITPEMSIVSEIPELPEACQVAKTTTEMSASAKPETPEVPEIPPLCNLAKITPEMSIVSEIPELLEVCQVAKTTPEMPASAKPEAPKVPEVYQVAKTTSEMSASAKPEIPEEPEFFLLCKCQDALAKIMPEMSTVSDIPSDIPELLKVVETTPKMSASAIPEISQLPVMCPMTTTSEKFSSAKPEARKVLKVCYTPKPDISDMLPEELEFIRRCKEIDDRDLKGWKGPNRIADNIKEADNEICTKAEKFEKVRQTRSMHRLVGATEEFRVPNAPRRTHSATSGMSVLKSPVSSGNLEDLHRAHVIESEADESTDETSSSSEEDLCKYASSDEEHPAETLQKLRFNLEEIKTLDDALAKLNSLVDIYKEISVMIGGCKMWRPISSPSYNTRPYVLMTHHVVPSLPKGLFEVLAEMIECVTKIPVLLTHEERCHRTIIPGEIVDIVVTSGGGAWPHGKLLPASFIFDHELNMDKSPVVYCDLIVSKECDIKDITKLQDYKCALTLDRNQPTAAGQLTAYMHSKGVNVLNFNNMLGAVTQLDVVKMVARNKAEVGAVESPVLKCHKYKIPGAEDISVLTTVGTTAPYRIMINKCHARGLMKPLTKFLLRASKRKEWRTRLAPYNCIGFAENSEKMYNWSKDWDEMYMPDLEDASAPCEYRQPSPGVLKTIGMNFCNTFPLSRNGTYPAAQQCRLQNICNITKLQDYKCALTLDRDQPTAAGQLTAYMHSKGVNVLNFNNMLGAVTQLDVVKMVARNKAEVGAVESPVLKCHKYKVPGAEDISVLTTVGTTAPYRIMINKCHARGLMKPLTKFLLRASKRKEWRTRLAPYNCIGFAENSEKMYNWSKDWDEMYMPDLEDASAPCE